MTSFKDIDLNQSIKSYVYCCFPNKQTTYRAIVAIIHSNQYKIPSRSQKSIQQTDEKEMMWSHYYCLSYCAFVMFRLYPWKKYYRSKSLLDFIDRWPHMHLCDESIFKGLQHLRSLKLTYTSCLDGYYGYAIWGLLPFGNLYVWIAIGKWYCG